MKTKMAFTAFAIAMTWTCGIRAQSNMPPRSMSELVPPTEEDWYRIDLIKRRLYPVDHCCAKPILVYREVYYFPCPEPLACGETSHRSFRGCYGIRHPMPYYIKEPKFEPPPAPWNCRRCAATQTQPNPYQQIARNPQIGN